MTHVTISSPHHDLPFGGDDTNVTAQAETCPDGDGKREEIDGRDQPRWSERSSVLVERDGEKAPVRGYERQPPEEEVGCDTHGGAPQEHRDDDQRELHQLYD